MYRGLLLFGATVLALWAFGLILWPFVVPIAWAACLCAVTARPYRWLREKWKKPRLAAWVMVAATAIMILAPMIYIGAMFVEEASDIKIDPKTIQRDLQEYHPETLERIDDALASLNLGSLEELLTRVKNSLPEIASKVSASSALEGALNVVMAPFLFLFGLVVTLVTQYFLYREAGRLRRLVADVSPLDEDDTGRILSTLQGATASAIAGGLLVALVQGMLGGIMFAIAGIHSPVMWGVIMAAFSLLPFGGTALIWAPAAGYLLLTGETAAGWFLIIFGATIVGTVDNVLRPFVLSRMGGEAVHIHPMLLFFAILSGIGLFGVSGIVFGPLLIALLTTMVSIYREHWRPDGAVAEA